MSEPKKQMETGPAPVHALLAEYETPAQLLAASRKVRDAGFTRWDTFTPFPVHGIDKAMGIKMTVLPWIVLGAGITGLLTAIVVQWWMNAVDYPWIISGKPFWSIPANVPVMFELTVLFSAITALVGMLMLNNLPLPSHPLDLVKRFARVTDDKFFLVIEAADAKFDERDTRALLDGTQPAAIEAVAEDRSSSDKLPSGLIYGLIILTVVAAIPFALAAKARTNRSPLPRIHAIGDMDWQPKYKSQRSNPVFPDKRATRPDVAGTVGVGELQEDDHFYRGKVGEAFATTFPEQVPLTDATMQRGRQRYGIYCAPCHGDTGEGDGMIAKRAEALQIAGVPGSWVPPTNVNAENIRVVAVGYLFDVISNGVRNMPPYGAQITTDDRWAIVMYLRALQRARAAKFEDVPPQMRQGLK